MARLMNYLLRLWLHCSDLSCDTGMFRTTLNKVQSSTCPLCSDDITTWLLRVQLGGVCGYGFLIARFYSITPPV